MLKKFIIVILILILSSCESQPEKIPSKPIPSILFYNNKEKPSTSLTPIPIPKQTFNNPINNKLPSPYPNKNITTKPSSKPIKYYDKSTIPNPPTNKNYSESDTSNYYNTGGSSSKNNSSEDSNPVETIQTPPIIDIKPTTIPTTNECQEWYCNNDSKNKLWMGKCCDNNKDKIFDITECYGSTPVTGFTFPKNCPIIPSQTPPPVISGGCVTFFCTIDSKRIESGKCCDKNKNGTYESEECTGKTPYNGYSDKETRCPQN